MIEFTNAPFTYPERTGDGDPNDGVQNVTAMAFAPPLTTNPEAHQEIWQAQIRELADALPLQFAAHAGALKSFASNRIPVWRPDMERCINAEVERRTDRQALYHESLGYSMLQTTDIEEGRVVTSFDEERLASEGSYTAKRYINMVFEGLDAKQLKVDDLPNDPNHILWAGFNAASARLIKNTRYRMFRYFESQIDRCTDPDLAHHMRESLWRGVLERTGGEFDEVIGQLYERISISENVTYQSKARRETLEPVPELLGFVTSTLPATTTKYHSEPFRALLAGERAFHTEDARTDIQEILDTEQQKAVTTLYGKSVLRTVELAENTRAARRVVQ